MEPSSKSIDTTVKLSDTTIALVHNCDKYLKMYETSLLQLEERFDQCFSEINQIIEQLIQQKLSNLPQA